MNKFELALEKYLEDWDLRLIYADWLEDNNDFILANAQRWMAKHKRRPFDGLIWMHISNATLLSCLPKNIYECLKNYTKETSDKRIKLFSSREDAERSLANALISWHVP